VGDSASIGESACYLFSVRDQASGPSLQRRLFLPVIGTVLGASAGFAYYWFFGCDSG